MVDFPINAVCKVGPGGKPCGGGNDDGNNCSGTVTFKQISDEDCEISWDIKGISKDGKDAISKHMKLLRQSPITAQRPTPTWER